MSRKRSSSSNKQQVRRHGLVVTTLTLVAIFASGLVYIKTQRDNRSVEVPAATEPAPPAAPRSTPRDTPPKYEFYAELPRRELVIERREPPPRQTQPAERPQIG